MKFIVTSTRERSYSSNRAPHPRCSREIFETCAKESNGDETVYRRSRWMVEISDLEDLLAFCRDSNHEVVICEQQDQNLPITLEIYDDYRE